MEVPAYKIIFHCVFLKIASIRIEVVEKTSEMRVLLLEFLFKL